jgi:hypothetical protein
VGSETTSPNIKAKKESDAEVEIVNNLNQASPLEGVEFTYEEFADALSKYDFSFEIGDMVSTPDMLYIAGTFFSFLTQAWNGHTNPKKREAYVHMYAFVCCYLVKVPECCPQG